jgi:hypothetical protein
MVKQAMDTFDFFEHVQHPPIQELVDYYGHTHEMGEYMPIKVQEFGIILVTLMDSKPVDNQKAIDYIAEFLTTFCNSTEQYNKLSLEGREMINSIRHSDNEFINKVLPSVSC